MKINLIITLDVIQNLIKMQNWIYFALIAQGIWSVTSLIDKFVISRGYIRNPLVYIILNGLMNIFLIFLLPFAGFEPIKSVDFLILIIGGAIFMASVAVYYKAVQYEDISKVIILYQLGPIFVLVLSFFLLNEALTKNHIVGFSMLLCAGLAVSYKKTDGRLKISKVFYLMLISMLLSSIGFVTAKYAYSITSFWSAFLWLRMSGFTALLVLVFPPVGRDAIKTFKAMPNKIKGLMTFKMVIDFSAFVFAGYALMNGPTSLVAALSSTVLPLFVFIWASAISIYFPSIIKEDVRKGTLLMKLAAIIFIIIGIIFINL